MSFPRVASLPRLLLVLASLGTTFMPHAARSQVLRDTWATNGPVYAVAVSGSILFLGGHFGLIGPAIAGAVALDASTAAPQAPYPQVLGEVDAVAADGSGGWYIGGSFISVRGVPRQNLAHLDAAGNVTAWNPSPDEFVSSLVVSGGRIYVGGYFTTIAGQTRHCLAAFDVATGALTTWNPDATHAVYSPVVNALAVSGSTVYIGGSFTGIQGTPRTCLAAVDAVTGSLTSWDPNPYGPQFDPPSVYALAVAGSTIAVGGHFIGISGVARNNIATVDLAGAAYSWNPDAGGDPYTYVAVYALAVSGATVYAGGNFTTMSGKARSYLAAIDPGGAATSWTPNADGAVRAIAVSGSTVFVGGEFTIIGGQARLHLAALNTATGTATNWSAHAGGNVMALAVTGTTVYVGGGFYVMGGELRNGLAALNTATGAATAWNPAPLPPSPGASIYALAVGGSTVYAGGAFTTMGGQPRNNIAAIDAASGATLGWSPFADGFVRALALSGSTVYAGGEFRSIGGLARNRIAALDATTGAASAWNPDADWDVVSLAPSGSTIYAGGWFSNIGGQPRNYIAALDAATGYATGWNPNAGTGQVPVFALAPSGSTVYAGGYFDMIGGQSRTGMAALSAATGNATGWNANSDGLARTFAVVGSTLYVGGEFTTIGGQPRYSLASLDITTAAASPWNPNVQYGGNNPYGEVDAIAVSGSTVYIGGSFLTVLGLPHSNFAAVSTATTAVNEPSPAALSSLIQAAPNPFRNQVALIFALPRAEQAEVAVYDLAGRQVRRLHRGVLEPGAQRFVWDGRSDEGRELDAGLYLVRVRTDDMSLTTRVARFR